MINKRSYKMNAEAQYMQVRNKLIQQAKMLRNDLNILIQSAEAGSRVNDLGEVQGSGSMVDVLCAKYMGAKRTLEDIEDYSEKE